jgi:spermidine synthase
LLVAFFLSGVTGVAAEVVWGKFLQLSIGATGTAHAVVLATFMGGLALGNALFGAVGDRWGNELRLYGILELSIGLLLALFPVAFEALSGLYLSLAAPDPMSSGNNLLRILFSASLILAPSTLMGGTLPVLTRLFVRRVDEVGRGVGRLYFINSLGAVFGCGLAGFILLPGVGLELSIMLPAMASIAVGLACIVWARRLPDGSSSPSAGDPTESLPAVYSVSQVRWVLGLMFLSGLLTMIYELSWIRLLGLVLGSSVYSFSVMLMTFIGGIALGSWWVSRFMRQPRDALLYLALAELGIALFVALMMPLYEFLPYFFNLWGQLLVRTPGTFPAYQFMKVLVCFGAMAMPTICLGMTLPLASHICVRSVSRLGRGVGTVFSINTLGNLVGAILAGHVVIAWVGLQNAMLVGLTGSTLIGLILLLLRKRTGYGLFPVALILAVLLAYLALVPVWHPAALNSGRYRAREAVAANLTEFRAAVNAVDVLYHEDGPDMSVAVLKSQRTGHISMMVNGKPDAATGGDMSTQVLLGQLAMLLHPDPKRGLVIGLGSGVTAGAALTAPIERLDVVEISADVMAASRFFDAYSGAPLDDPRTHLSIADARDFLLLNEGAGYDVIISEPSNPWMAGIGNLMTVEFFEVARRSLRQGGLMVQWLHLYEMSPEVLGVILNTYSAVFPHVTVWCPRNADILLLGALQPLQIDLEQLDSRVRQPGVQATLSGSDAGGTIGSGLEFLAMQVLSNAGFKKLYPGKGRLNHDVFPFVEYAAPIAFYTGEDVRDFFTGDERLQPRHGNQLYLALALGDAVLTPSQLRGFIRFFAEGSTRYDDDQMERLIWHLMIGHVDLAGGSLSTGSDSAAEVQLNLDPFLRRGDHRRLGDLLLWQKMIANGLMSRDDWARYLRFEGETSLRTVTVFAANHLARYDAAWQGCLDRDCLPLEELCQMRALVREQAGFPAEAHCP